MSQQHPTGPYAFGERIERVVAFHAERTPDAVAVQQGDRTLGYAELTARAGQVAGSLAAAGVGPGDVVPVLIRRSPELVVALLGVLHAGAAYVAVDPAWPQERIGEVVRHRGRAPVLTADALGPPGGGSAPPPAYSDGTQAACVFFTSGSTGRPKGAVSPHRGTVRTLVGCPTVPLDRNTVFLQAAPLPWDGLSLELWAPLLNGGRCVLLEPGVRAPDSTSLGAAVADGVNSLWLTSALFTVLADETPDVFAHLRLLLVGGERVPASPVRRVLRRFPGLHMVNGYGPAESTIFATTHVIRPADVAGPGDDIPIGRPVPRTTVALLAPDGKPVGPGETGEIAIGGDGLALGYLGDPEQTAASFYGSGPDRYYRTGDLACRDDEGNLRFRGRADRQFKIRGFRVEPGEVEAAVEAHPRVSACCAVKVETSRQRHEIVCVYATAAAGPVDPAELRALVARRLPDALVPTAFRHVPRLPRTVNGKVDRSAVRALLRPQPAAAPPAPGVDAVTATVREMLGRPGLTDHDDLLDAGLNSLDAVRLASRVATTTGARITVGDVYRLRTLAALRAADPAPPGPAP
ncbi:MAG: non-ribosomal peptide synthetase, partial [Streptomycetaceae bacterium]|nr:non-ribosomal peptide synthetase [Streptomycetaceae bacterium]